jgi:hypothetical protein
MWLSSRRWSLRGEIAGFIRDRRHETGGETEERPRGKQRAEPPVSDLVSNEAGRRQDVAVQESWKLYCTLSAAQGKLTLFETGSWSQNSVLVKLWAVVRLDRDPPSFLTTSWPRRYTLLKFLIQTFNIQFQRFGSRISTFWRKKQTTSIDLSQKIQSIGFRP